MPVSRIPHPTSSRTPLKAPATGTPSKARVGATTSTPVRTRTKSTVARSATPSRPPPQEEPAPPVPALSIKEAIALKRAEAKKAQGAAGGSALDSFATLEDSLPTATKSAPVEEDILGRWSVKETIERGRSTGTVNLATRSLPCIPSALFEIHLGIKPDPLKLVPIEPPLPASESEAAAPRRGGKRDAPAWFEAQDLQVLKAWNNDIVEVQHEISLFGSLKFIDLHKNKLQSIPSTFGDLMALTTLDLSHNALTVLPDNIFALPELTILNISHNNLTSLPFNAPFAGVNSYLRDQSSGGSFFTPIIHRAASPLPRLSTLDASHNKITVNAIDIEIPQSITKLDLSANPLGAGIQPLLRKLGSLPSLKELRFEHAEISDDAFPSDLFSSSSFPSLRLLDLGETKVTPDAAKSALKGLKQNMSYDVTTEDPPEGTTRVIVGKRVVKEYWEIEAEKNAKARAARSGESAFEWGATDPEEGLTEGAKRRLRAAAASTAAAEQQSGTPRAPAPKTEVVKEAWEIEAEQGLLTEGGKRRARAAAAAAAAAEAEKQSQASLGVGTPSSPSKRSSSPLAGFSLANPQYYSSTTHTLTLPPSSAPSKAFGHARAFSLAASVPSSFSSTTTTTDIALPTPTLPLAEISVQPFAQTLRVLILINRRADRSFTLPIGGDGDSIFLPCLEELSLEGCGLPGTINRSNPPSGSTTPPRTTEQLLPLITNLFPSLQTLNLSYNTLTSPSLTTEVLSSLILSGPHRKGLKHLRLRGNRLTDLDGLQGLAELFRGNRDVPGWCLDELDLRDNEIGKLPPELGLLPLDVFLVDGNTFRVPARRIWEREGTKGLLSWLRGRIE